ncbi:MAG TPA: hypothetical protein VF125_07900 [Solirubrobacterales bacterium]
MSVRALNEIAAQREQGGARKIKRQPASQKATKEVERQGYLDLLVGAIPTEPLALYTFVVAGVVTTIDPGTDQRLTMRWVLFAAAIAFILAWMIAAFLRLPGDQKRALPWAEVSSAVVAFAAWGLVMPESPLAAELSATNQTVWTFIIIGAGVALLGLLTGSMKKPIES